MGVGRVSPQSVLGRCFFWFHLADWSSWGYKSRAHPAMSSLVYFEAAVDFWVPTLRLFWLKGYPTCGRRDSYSLNWTLRIITILRLDHIVGQN